jgi:hypothetical protein
MYVISIFSSIRPIIGRIIRQLSGDGGFMFVCRSRSCVERNQQRSVKVCMHCRVVLTPMSRSVWLVVLMESGIALLTVRNPYVHRIVVS